MILSSLELRELYESVVSAFGHPDPIGFITRALIMSEGDADFIGDDGEYGFMPLTPERAQEVGVSDIFSLQTNVTAALSIDRINYDAFDSVDDMILAFHFEGYDPERRNSEHNNFINEIDESRSDTYSIMYPRFATVKDVIKLLSTDVDERELSKEELTFFKALQSGV